jgi:hypothetical protein
MQTDLRRLTTEPLVQRFVSLSLDQDHTLYRDDSDGCNRPFTNSSSSRRCSSFDAANIGWLCSSGMTIRKHTLHSPVAWRILERTDGRITYGMLDPAHSPPTAAPRSPSAWRGAASTSGRPTMPGGGARRARRVGPAARAPGRRGRPARDLSVLHLRRHDPHAAGADAPPLQHDPAPRTSTTTANTTRPTRRYACMSHPWLLRPGGAAAPSPLMALARLAGVRGAAGRPDGWRT